jgi:hypothetical protein
MHSLFWSSPLGRLVVGLGVFTFAFWALAAAALLAWSPGRGVAMAAASHLAARSVRAADAATTPDTGDDSCSAMCDDASSNSYSYSYSTGGDDDQDFGWAVLDAGNVMVIDGGEPDHVRAYVRRGQPLFWFRDANDEYWVTDRALVDEARRATTRVQALGQEMGKVGAEMGRHGAAMGRVGGRMGSIGARIAMMEARLAADQDLSTAELEHQRETLHELRDQLGDLQAQLGDEQSEHARSQRQLSRRMSELSAQHEEALREARTKLRDIARRARQQGKAERPHANA